MPNLLESIAEQTQRQPASFWLERCDALQSEGLPDLATTLAAIAKDAESSDYPQLKEAAKRALFILRRINLQVGTTREAIEEAVGQAFKTVSSMYGTALKAALADEHIDAEDPRASKLKRYTSLHASCHAEAVVLRDVLMKRSDGRSPVQVAVFTKPLAIHNPSPVSSQDDTGPEGADFKLAEESPTDGIRLADLDIDPDAQTPSVKKKRRP